MELAIYGKGGIGKSTISANISASLAMDGKKVLQIGCDPKHDSTRQLLNGKEPETVLDYIRSVGPADYRLQDVLLKGRFGVGCIEAGGPRPGVGCAGRGIITAFDFLERFHVKDDYDIVLYDVLGDVVCGGFAVPIRREYADRIILVTSGEFMSVYAANNILRGIKNYDGDRSRVLGIVLNCRNVEDEEERVSAFADAVSLPILAKIPRDEIFALAEREGRTAVEYPGPVSDLLKNLSSDIPDLPLYKAAPLSDEELEECILSVKKKDKTAHQHVSGNAGASITDAEDRILDDASHKEHKEKEQYTEQENAEEHEYRPGYLSKNVYRNEPLHGCAFNGAVTMSSNITDVPILAHGPLSCIYITYQTISSTGRRALFERGTILPSSLSPNLLSTTMDENDMVFGAMDKLLNRIREITEGDDPPKAVVVVSTCPAGIIGDDIEQAAALSTERTKVVVIKADGNLTGDYLQGMLTAYTELAKQIIDKDVPKVPDRVNIVFEKVIAKNTEQNFKLMESYLNRMGISVNCRFLTNTTYDALRSFNSAPLNLLANRDYTGLLLEDFFKREYDAEFYPEEFPVGFYETCKWLRGMGRYFGKEKEAEEIIREHQGEYESRIEKVRKVLKGKTLMIITYNHELDWMIGAAFDAGMQIPFVGIMNFSQDEGFRTELKETSFIGEITEDYDAMNRHKDVERIKPDILLTNYDSGDIYPGTICDTIPMCPDCGFYSGVEMLERWIKASDKGDKNGGWTNDKGLFDKYFAR